jgi:hypothetical protein
VQPRWSRLSLTERVVLCLVSEKPTHSFAIASLLAKDGSLGQVWHVPKAVACRSAARLVQRGLITAAESNPAIWDRPARSLRPLPKASRRQGTGCASRVNSDPGDLLHKQRAQLVPVADALAVEVYTASGFDQTLALWRHESVSALRFLDDLLAAMPAQSSMRERGKTPVALPAATRSSPRRARTTADRLRRPGTRSCGIWRVGGGRGQG